MGGLLEEINSPDDLKRLPIRSLPRVCAEARDAVVEAVCKSGGHLASNLGVAELTVALHYVFDFAHDRLLWDVGHQCYVHKILTGRREQLLTRLRQDGGLSGFPSIDEGPYDQFSVGHAGTAVATAVGLARGDLIRDEADRRIVAVVGDASIVNGLSFEGLNQAGVLKRQFLVVLNDNSMGIAPTQGGLAEYLAKFRTSDLYDEVKRKAKRVLPRLPLGQGIFDTLEHIKEGIKATISPHQIFEQLGLLYAGPVDGHDVAHLIELLRTVKDVQQPVLLHVHTQKGRGADFAAEDPCKFHSPKSFVVQNGKATITAGDRKSWTDAFADSLIEIAAGDERVFALTAAMPDGTGLTRFAEQYPDRFWDVGIAESCTVDVAAGLAKAGLRPFAAIYSTFLQRAVDQVFQEVVLQGLPVVLCIDRAGPVGGDGAVHHGFLDIAYLRGMPGMTLLAPADEQEMHQALRFALAQDGPVAIRYPRDSVPDPLGETADFELGRARSLRPGKDAVVLAYGSVVATALDAAEALKGDGYDVGVVNARFAKPVDRQAIRDALAGGRTVLTVEEHSLAGGFGSAVLEAAQQMGLDTSRIERLGMPVDRLIPHGSRARQLADCGIDAAGIARAVRDKTPCNPRPRPSKHRSSQEQSRVG